MASQDDSQPSQDSVMTVTDDNRQEVLYFAYGSNLSTDQMRERCPFSSPVGLGYLPGWRWIVNKRGYANIVQQQQQQQGAATPQIKNDGQEREGEAGVYGLLYLLPSTDEELLDRFEDVPAAYQKFQVDVRWVKNESGEEVGDVVRALVYIDVQRVEEGEPRGEYVARMERGIRDAVACWGMEEGYADRVMRKFW